MLFKTLTKQAFKALVQMLLGKTEVIGPKRVGTNKDGNPIHQFLPVATFEEMDLEYEKTEFSPKTYFLPYRENLSVYNFKEGDWTQEIKYRVQPRVLFGLHPCDINGILKLDRVFIRDQYPSPYYVSRRKNTMIVGLDHEPCADGFCRAVGADAVNRGFDLFFTDIGDKYVVAIGSDRGMAALNQSDAQPLSDDDTRHYVSRRKAITKKLDERLDFDTKSLPNLLDIEFDSPVWKKWGAKCLSCGSCAMVCPTCYCYGVYERVAMDFQSGAKVKQLHSCNLIDFALVAGGHNFRPASDTRLKYRYYHQHRGFVEQYDEPKCVGCNRCGRTCLAGINPRDVIRDLQAEEAK
jgi:sulfhydrogenase subunit beta (sulfur reductase)